MRIKKEKQLNYNLDKSKNLGNDYHLNNNNYNLGKTMNCGKECHSYNSKQSLNTNCIWGGYPLNKGLTLIELMAVIIIIAIIALIAVPTITGLIEVARIGAFKESVRFGIDATNQYAEINGITDLTLSMNNSEDKKVMQLKNNNFEDGEFIYDKKNSEANLVTDGKYCATGNKENLKVTKGNCSEVGKLPDIVLLAGTSKTTSITAIMSIIGGNGIERYCFQIKEESGAFEAPICNEGPLNNTKTFESLTEGTKYYIKGYVEIVGSLQKEADEIEIITKQIPLPIITGNNANWESSKIIMITYPTGVGYTYEYIKDGNVVTTTNIVETVTFTENGTLVARVYLDDEFEQVTENVINIDSTPLIIDLSGVPENFRPNTTYSVPTSYTTATSSGTTIVECKVGSIVITNTSSLTDGTHTINCKLETNDGREVNQSKTVVVSLPILAIGTFGSSSSNYLGTTIRKNQIESIEFLDTLTEPIGNIGTFDVSALGDNSVRLYYTNSSAIGKYDIYIAGSSGVYANPNSGALFHSVTVKEFDFTHFDTSKATNMGHMFYQVPATHLDLSSGNFDTSNVIQMNDMFSQMTQLQNLNLGSNFDTSSVENMSLMFLGLYALSSIDLGNKFDTSNVTNMTSMFAGFMNGGKLTQLNLGNKFYTSNVTKMTNMFGEQKNLINLDLGSNFDTSKVTDMYNMFRGMTKLTSLNLGDKFDTSNVTDMGSMFYEVESLQSLNLGNKFNTNNVTNMVCMFQRMRKLTSLNISQFNTSKVTNMGSMFQEMESLTSLNLGSNFDTSEVTNMSMMFYGAIKLSTLNLGSKFYTSKVYDIFYMFKNTPMLTSLDFRTATFNGVTSYLDMFSESKTVRVKSQTEKDWLQPKFPSLNIVIG